MIINKTISLFLLLTVLLTSCKENLNNESYKNLVEVAVLLPLSGKSMDLAKECEKMVKLGLKNNAKIHIRATSYDISTREKLQEAIDKVNERETNIIIMGLSNHEFTKNFINSIKYDPIIITLSNDPTLATSKDNLFVLGHAPMKQFTYLVNFLLEDGYKNYILMLRNNNNNHYTTSKILEHMVASGGGSILKTEYYDTDNANIQKSVKQIADIVDDQNEHDYNLRKPVIIVSDTEDVLNVIFNNMIESRLDKKAIIAGDNKINIKYDKNINLLYTGSSNEIYTTLEKEFINRYIDAIFYDAGGIVAAAIGNKFEKERFLNYINSSEFVFEGASGTIKFSDRIADRAYSIINRSE